MFFDIGIGLLLATIVGMTTGSNPSWLWLVEIYLTLFLTETSIFMSPVF